MRTVTACAGFWALVSYASIAWGASVPGPKLGRVPTTDVDLATFTYGGGSSETPVVVVNGGPGLSHVYLIQNDVWTRRIAAGRPVLLYDQRGTGASHPKRPDVAQSMDAQVADLEAIRASLHVEKVFLAGDSYGGLLASAYAAVHPEHVRALILSDSAAPGFGSLHPRLGEVFPDIVAETQAKRRPMTGPDRESQISDLQLRAHFRMIFYSAASADQYLRAAHDLGSTPATGAAVSKAIASLDLTPQMAQFRFPVLVLQGRFDLNVTPDVSWKVAHQIPGAQLVWFEQSGHLPYYEEPGKYVSVVTQFLRAH